VFRIDSHYFSKAAIASELTLKNRRWETLGDASSSIQSFGAYALTNQFTYTDEGIPFLRCLNIKNGFVELANSLFIPPTAQTLLSKSAVKPGMVLLTMSGSVGEAAVALPSWTYPINSNQDIAKIVPDPGVSPYFLTAFLNSRYGKTQAERLPVGSVQQHIFLWMLEELVVVPRFSDGFEAAIASAVQTAYERDEDAQRFLADAEKMLTAALGLRDWHPPEPLTYTLRASQALESRRLDAEYFAPRVRELLAKLGASGRSLHDVAPPRHEKFIPAREGEFCYIEISDLHSDGTVGATRLAQHDAPSRATQFVRAGDVITSTVRPIRGLSALILPAQGGSVCSSGFVVLEPRAIAAEVLLTYLRLPLVCELMDLHTSASMYPAISETDLLRMPFPELGDAKTTEEIVAAVRHAHAGRRRAHDLLSAAQRSVEMAIEENESTALNNLKRQV